MSKKSRVKEVWLARVIALKVYGVIENVTRNHGVKVLYACEKKIVPVGMDEYTQPRERQRKDEKKRKQK